MDDPCELVVVTDDRQDVVEVEAYRWAELANEVLLGEGVEGPGELSLAFIEANEIARLKAEYLDGDGNPTDVLAFPLDATSDGTAPMRLLGDVLICPEVAAKNATDNKGCREGHDGSFEHEMSLLVVHGVLHILGMDHQQEAQGALMRASEQIYLDAHWGVAK